MWAIAALAVLALASGPGLVPESSAFAAGGVRIVLAWTADTPDPLRPGLEAGLGIEVSATADTDAVVRLRLANSTAVQLPATCHTEGVVPTSAISQDGRRAVCNLGRLLRDESETVVVPLLVGDADVVAVQEGTYDNEGQVLVRSVAAPHHESYYRLLSSPDFLNVDIADLRESPWASWRRGQPNSWNASHRTFLARLVNDWKGFDPDGVAVAGDLVNGRWIRDPDRVRAFGPVDTAQHRRNSIRRAAKTYFAAWRGRFVDAGLRVFPGIGDHDLGDDPWTGSRLWDEKRTNAPLYRRLFARMLTRRKDGSWRYPDRPVGSPWAGTAYAVRPHPEVELISIDVFRSVSGDVVNQVSGGQLRWLEDVLARSVSDGVEWIVVQGHVPIAGPVRKGPSSELVYAMGRDSALWRVFKKYGVDVYLCGEMHANTAIVTDGIVQLTHGGNVGFGTSATSLGGTSFVVSDFSDTELSMRLYSWDRTRGGGTLWQMGTNRIRQFQQLVAGPIEIGALVVVKSGSSPAATVIVVDRQGQFRAFEPPAGGRTAVWERAQVR